MTGSLPASPELVSISIQCSSKSWALFEIHSPQENRTLITFNFLYFWGVVFWKKKSNYTTRLLEMIIANLALRTSLAMYNLLSNVCKSTYLVHNSWLLQEILFNSSSFNNRMSVKVDVDVFPKSTGVVIPYGLCIAEGWKATKINHGVTALRHAT